MDGNYQSLDHRCQKKQDLDHDIPNIVVLYIHTNIPSQFSVHFLLVLLVHIYIFYQ